MTKAATMFRGRPITAQERRILREEEAYVGLCFTMLEGYSLPQIAKRAGLGYTTVWRLRVGLTYGINAMTIRKLGKAAGLELTWQDQQPRLRVVAAGKARRQA